MLATSLVAFQFGHFEDAPLLKAVFPVPGNGILPARSASGMNENPHERRGKKPMAQTIQKNVRFAPGQWKRLEKEAEKRE